MKKNKKTISSARFSTLAAKALIGLGYTENTLLKAYVANDGSVRLNIHNSEGVPMLKFAKEGHDVLLSVVVANAIYNAMNNAVAYSVKADKYGIILNPLKERMIYEQV